MPDVMIQSLGKNEIRFESWVVKQHPRSTENAIFHSSRVAKSGVGVTDAYNNA